MWEGFYAEVLVEEVLFRVYRKLAFCYEKPRTAIHIKNPPYEYGHHLLPAIYPLNLLNDTEATVLCQKCRTKQGGGVQSPCLSLSCSTVTSFLKSQKNHSGIPKPSRPVVPPHSITMYLLGCAVWNVLAISSDPSLLFTELNNPSTLPLLISYLLQPHRNS